MSTPVSPGSRDITVYVGFRPFEGEWLERNQSVLQGLLWQHEDGPAAAGLKIKFVCWPDEVATASWAAEHGYDVLVVPWVRHYLFSGPQRSFKAMFETAMLDCDTELFCYINGDIVLGPGIVSWLQNSVERATLYSLPRHNWEWTAPLNTPNDFEKALEASVPEEWTAVDLFAMRATEARRDFLPLPPFLLTAGSMDSWLVAHSGAMGWSRTLIPPDIYQMLHIEHEFSHPLKPGASADKLAKWAFNCGVYAHATQGLPNSLTADTSLACFNGAQRYSLKHRLPQTTYQTPEECMTTPGKSNTDKSDD